MDRYVSVSDRVRTGLGRWLVAVVAALGLGLSGCTNLNLRGESFREDELSGLCRQLRPRDPKTEAWGVSNKARQIEKDFGYE